MNLAYLWGATDIVLLGYDMQRTGGQSHWHGDHPRNLNKSSPFQMFLQAFPALAADLSARGVRVLNASRETALTCFKRATLEEALC